MPARVRSRATASRCIATCCFRGSAIQRFSQERRCAGTDDRSCRALGGGLGLRMACLRFPCCERLLVWTVPTKMGRRGPRSKLCASSASER